MGRNDAVEFKVQGNHLCQWGLSSRYHPK